MTQLAVHDGIPRQPLPLPSTLSPSCCRMRVQLSAFMHIPLGLSMQLKVKGYAAAMAGST